MAEALIVLEAWCAERGAGPLRWTILEDGMLLGHCGRYGVVVRALLLPDGCSCAAAAPQLGPDRTAGVLRAGARARG
jgi:hypothetical protein